jgi:hypothetical protein
MIHPRIGTANYLFIPLVVKGTPDMILPPRIARSGYSVVCILIPTPLPMKIDP